MTNTSGDAFFPSETSPSSIEKFWCVVCLYFLPLWWRNFAFLGLAKICKKKCKIGLAWTIGVKNWFSHNMFVHYFAFQIIGHPIRILVSPSFNPGTPRQGYLVPNPTPPVVLSAINFCFPTSTPKWAADLLGGSWVDQGVRSSPKPGRTEKISAQKAEIFQKKWRKNAHCNWASLFLKGSKNKKKLKPREGMPRFFCQMP